MRLNRCLSLFSFDFLGFEFIGIIFFLLEIRVLLIGFQLNSFEFFGGISLCVDVFSEIGCRIVVCCLCLYSFYSLI